MSGMAQNVPFVDLPKQNSEIIDDAMRRVRKVIEHGGYILGPEVGEFESTLAEFLNVDHVIGVNSGTDALVLSLRAHGIGPGDEVIMPSHTFLATAAAIRLVGATPVFADVDRKSMLMDAQTARACMTDRTAALLPVHLNGYPCDMPALNALAAEHNLIVIEDAAQSLGARRQDRATGSFGTGCFSLHPLKVLGACGDAGFITTSDAGLAQELRERRNLGLENRDEAAHISGNSRLDTLHAAILLAKLPKLPEWIERRRAHAAAYREALAGLVTLPHSEPDVREIFSPFVIRVDEDRDGLQKSLLANGIDTKVHYPIPVHRQKPYAEFARSALPETEMLAKTILSIPCSPELSKEQRDRVIAAIQEERS